MEESRYIVSARKYRPDTFASVVGQEALVTTLKNAIAKNKLAHAYLFSGPRGVGKTTCARIFAKTINCTHRTPEGEACNQCESCQAFNSQRSLNIYEMDAASNNSVNDIKQLIEQVQIMPSLGQYKVYIIDEVHMLSSAAFNAFLKTLEEPPAHAVFILATTEKHKLLATILSRCQIYDFNRITLQDIVKHLAFVAESEDITYEPESLQVVALKADGGMRDALSIFDQVVSYSGGALTYVNTIENLHVLDYEYYFKLVDCFLNSEVHSSMLIVNEILGYGFDGRLFINGLASHIRDLMVSANAQTGGLLEVGASIRKRYLEQGKRTHLAFLYRALSICVQTDLDYRESNNKRLLVEMAIIKLCQIMKPAELPEPLVASSQKVQRPFDQANSAKSSQKATSVSVQSEVIGSSVVTSDTNVQTSTDKPDSNNQVGQSETSNQVDKTAPLAKTLSKRMSLGIGKSNVKIGGQPAVGPNEISEEVVEKKSDVTPSSVEKNDKISSNNNRDTQSREFFSEEELVRKWDGVVANIEDNRNILRAVLEGRPISKQSDCEASIELLSEVDLQQVQSNYDYIINRMRQELKQPNFEIRFAIKALKAHEQKLSGVELYNHMVDKNEAVRGLRRLFDLHL